MSAFEIEPPEITIRGKKTKLRPVGRGANRIWSQLANVKDEQAKASAYVVAYAAIYSLPPGEAFAAVTNEERFNELVGAADEELSNADLAAVDEYLTGVFTRAQEATVIVDTSPGKQTTGETPPQS
jgi:hypothetical protein